MSQASKARRASYRRQVRESQRLGWSWSLRENGEAQLRPECDDLDQAHVMHKVSPNAQHMTAVQSFACFRVGDQAYMLGEQGLPLPASLACSVYFQNMHKAGARVAAEKQRTALLTKQKAQANELCRAAGILPTQNNRALMLEVMAEQARISQAKLKG